VVFINFLVSHFRNFSGHVDVLNCHPEIVPRGPLWGFRIWCTTLVVLRDLSTSLALARFGRDDKVGEVVSGQ